MGGGQGRETGAWGPIHSVLGHGANMCSARASQRALLLLLLLPLLLCPSIFYIGIIAVAYQHVECWLCGCAICLLLQHAWWWYALAPVPCASACLLQLRYSVKLLSSTTLDATQPHAVPLQLLHPLTPAGSRSPSPA